MDPPLVEGGSLRDPLQRLVPAPLRTDRAGEGDPDADLGGGAGDAVRLAFQTVGGERVVAMHGRTDAGERHAAERDGGFEPGVERGDQGRQAGVASLRQSHMGGVIDIRFGLGALRCVAEPAG